MSVYSLSKELGYNPHKSLSWTLTRLGYTTKPSGKPNSVKHIYKNGWLVFKGRAYETWAWLEANGETK